MTKPTFDFTDRPLKAEFDNPHDFEVQEVRLILNGSSRRRFQIIGAAGRPLSHHQLYLTQDEADQALGDMIADDDADRRLNRNRHEGSEP